VDQGHVEESVSAQAAAAASEESVDTFASDDVVDGTVLSVERTRVVLDLGHQTQGVVARAELSIRRDVDPADVVAVGDHVQAVVLHRDTDGPVVLSLKRARQLGAWPVIEQAHRDETSVSGTVVEVVKGGLLLDLDGVPGFLPASLVELRRVRDLQPYVGRQLEARIIELNQARHSVVLSRRAHLEQSRSHRRGELLEKLAKGQVRKGVVSSIVNFGAFVDLGGVEGMVHVSELAWQRVEHPSEVVRVGQEVEVEVLDVNLERKRVSLSLKATQEDPWRRFARLHGIGQLVGGSVTKLVPFGAFVRVDDGIEGLVHVSQLADHHVEAPEEVVRLGLPVVARILDIDLERRRVSLSIKQANEGFVEGEEYFDPTQYGMAAAYDADGNYIYPEGFDAESGEWLDGFEAQREEWERDYAAARQLWELHAEQVRTARQLPAPAGRPGRGEGRGEGRGDGRGEGRGDRSERGEAGRRGDRSGRDDGRAPRDAGDRAGERAVRQRTRDRRTEAATEAPTDPTPTDPAPADPADPLSVVTASLQRVWAPGAARVWLDSPNTFLAGRTPMQAVAAGELQAVLDAIDAEASGVFA